jgi:uncharacterized protein YegP (UPF0339 family)
VDHIEIYKGRGGLKRSQRWRWRYVATGNHGRLATGAEAYSTQADALAGMRRVCGLPDPIPAQDGWQEQAPQEGVERAWRVTRYEDNTVLVIVKL